MKDILSCETTNRVEGASAIMAEFAESTGISTMVEPRRYLWTDAFAVCNFVELYRCTGEERWYELALKLVDQVHEILGKHRHDDTRRGWISGLSEEDGRRRPTAGGLRIGKAMNERGHGDDYDDQLEWERDGQYFHYLTKWMHALNKVSRATGDPVFNYWAIELAKSVHGAFVRTGPGGSKEMAWKMSIDLSRPLVPLMGQHDPLDGLITYHELHATKLEFPKPQQIDLFQEIGDLEALARQTRWETDDPLGIGSLLWDAHKVLQLTIGAGFEDGDLLNDLLEASLKGLDSCLSSPFWNYPADGRLAFRELGLSIGLQAFERVEVLVKKRAAPLDRDHPVVETVDNLSRYAGVVKKIEEFWLDPQNRLSRNWTGHSDINWVMLATSLVPDGFLEL